MSDDPIEETLNLIRNIDEKRYDAIMQYKESRTLQSLYRVFSVFDQYLDPIAVDYFKYLFDFIPGGVRLASLIVSGRHYFVILGQNGDLYLEW